MAKPETILKKCKKMGKAVETIRVKSAETLEITFRDGRTVTVSLK